MTTNNTPDRASSSAAMQDAAAITYDDKVKTSAPTCHLPGTAEDIADGERVTPAMVKDAVKAENFNPRQSE